MVAFKSWLLSRPGFLKSLSGTVSDVSDYRYFIMMVGKGAELRFRNPAYLENDGMTRFRSSFQVRVLEAMNLSCYNHARKIKRAALQDAS